ncbi:hypothetical protein QYE76_040797 [Lolium multiflorum]|uniref:Retrotransposon gag domain-containing protein n=1 Tax=Lolium multiflorum TaxID=4521 RepID=A0AAD8TDP6_LOLMU|nr:hypothetical protein QYE76_040797 [Lolium multiflorum]
MGGTDMMKRRRRRRGTYRARKRNYDMASVRAVLLQIQGGRRRYADEVHEAAHPGDDGTGARADDRRSPASMTRCDMEVEARQTPEGGYELVYEELISIMAYTFPKRTLRKVEGWLGDYDGQLTDLLRGMLKELHCETRIPVLKYIYYDGEIVAKCRVSVQLPMQLEMSRIMPYGEAKTITTAFHMAIFKAILEIRQHKSVELLCSEYSHIPHAEEDEDPTLNHLLMANKHPEVAAQHMDNCKSLLTTMYLLHMKMVDEINHMLAEFTDPDKVQARMHDLRAQPQYTTPFFSLNNPVDWSGQGDDSWNLNCSESPIENSTGWRFGEPFGDEEEPIPCDTGDESGGVNQYINRHYGQEEKGTDSISLDLEMGLSKPSQYEVGESGVKKKKKKKMRGQVDRNPSWMAEEGAPEPMDAEDWLMDTERKLRTVGCNDEEKIRYATYLLSGPAASWWENLVAYTLQIRLARYAPEDVDTEEKRKKRFMKGMNPYMKMQLRLARTAEFQELDSAITFEDDYRQVQEDRRKRARRAKDTSREANTG